MRAQDLTVEVRDVDLARHGQILPQDLVLNAKVRWCGVGEWTVTLPGDHAMVPYLRAPGSGLLVTWTNPETQEHEVLFSGPTTLPTRKRGIENPDGTLTFQGVTDEIHLADSLAYPDPATLDAGAQTQANDIQSGSTEALMRHFVEANIGPSAPSGRRRGMLQYIELEGTNADLGLADTARSPRFTNLLELEQSLAVEGTLGFRVVQVDEALQFQIRPVRDLRGTIRLDVNAGTLISEEVAIQGPTLVDAIVAGQGEGTDRTIITRTTTEAEDAVVAYGRVPQRFFDRRDTNDLLELQAKGDEELEAGRGGTSAKVIPADESTMRYMIDWMVGDWLNVVIEGSEEESVITEAVFVFDKDRSTVGASLGDVTSFDPRDVQSAQQKKLDSRVGYLERNLTATPVGSMMQYLGAAAPDGWLLCQGQSLLRADYQALFAILGTAYGAADGTHFNLPDLRGRVPVGKSADVEFDTLGETGGAKTHTLTTAQLPAHQHMFANSNSHSFSWGGAGGTDVYAANAIVNAGGPPSNNLTTDQDAWNRTATDGGSGQAHNNLQPYIVTNYIVKT